MNTSLNSYEIKLVTDAEVLLTKNRIIEKVYNIFGNLSEFYTAANGLDINFGEELFNAKISRGDNYQGLPYVILDYPRQFSKENIFAIRSLFWWGNFFSITLQLAGRYKHFYQPMVQQAIDNGFLNNWYISKNTDPWQHHFEVDNYQLITNENKLDLQDLPFIKIAKKIPLVQWEETGKFYEENFIFIMKILKNQAPIL